MAQTYVPTVRTRTSTVTNGGTTVQDIYNTRTEDRTVTDTKNLTDLTTRALTETIQADIGGPLTFTVDIVPFLPVQLPRPPYPNTPHTT